MYERWQDLANAATYAMLRGIDGSIKEWPLLHYEYERMIGAYGAVENKHYIGTSHGARFSINTTRPPKGSLKGQDHHWVYPNKGDRIAFYDATLRLIGVWDGTKVIATATQRKAFSDELFGTLDREGATALFKASTAKAKGGYRAIVEFNSVVVWEGSEVYADDLNYKEGNYEDGGADVGTSGLQKAQKAADSAVEQAVEALFSKVKV